MCMIGAAIAVLGIGSLYGQIELGWHWMFVPMGVWVIFGGGIVDGWFRRGKSRDE